MKLLISFTLLLLSLSSIAQLAPPKKSSKVIANITNRGSKDFHELCRILFEEGYSFETRDSLLKIVATNPLPSKKYGTVSKIRASFSDTTITFTSQISLQHEIELFGEGQPSVKNYYPVEFSGAKKSAMREAWIKMEEVAKRFGPVSYSK